MTALGRNGEHATTHRLFHKDSRTTVSHPLLTAYQRTQYQAETPLGTLTLRIGEHNALLDTLLAEHQTPHWAYITAWNPGSTLLVQENNEQRQQALKALLIAKEYRFYSGYGCPDPEHDSHWIPEASVLILGITLEQATECAERFGQWGIVYGQRGDTAKLAVLHQALLENHDSGSESRGCNRRASSTKIAAVAPQIK